MTPSERLSGLGGRALYAFTSTAVFFSQHLVILAVSEAAYIPLNLPWWFWVNPFRAVLFNQSGGVIEWNSPLLILAMVATGLADVILVWLAFQRGRRNAGGGWLAILAAAPAAQLGVILWLTLSPDHSRHARENEASDIRLSSRTAALGLALGVGAIVFAVALSALVFGIYGYALFLASPFLIAVAVSFLANRKGFIGHTQTFGLICCTFLVGGAALIGFAMEGVICLIFASPLIVGMGLLGQMFGTALAQVGRPRRHTMLSSVALLPLLIAAEAILPPHATFENVVFTDVAAPPAAVWDAVIHMGPIPNAPPAPFRWGLAYPVRGEILGTGVGSIRRGVFSTGVAYERVTEWEPDKRLSFIVLSDPPTMHEMSPYHAVNAPHTKGYFRTLDARFTLTPLANGKTRLVLATHHELDLEPALYWAPLAEWAVNANKERVLAHFRQQAEADVIKR